MLTLAEHNELINLRQEVARLQAELQESTDKEILRLKRRLVQAKHRNKVLRGTVKKNPRYEAVLLEIEQIKKDGFEGTAVNQIKKLATKHFIGESYATDLWYKGK